MLKYLIGKQVTLYPIDGGLQTNAYLAADMIFKGQAYNYDGNLQFIPCFYSGGNVGVCMFGIPAIAFAMLRCVPKGEERKQAGSIIISAALTAFFCGVGEPL
jgi:phosphotransferase system  glucose/maltose/N-acetylglucosamine-specific IIC component